MKKFALAREYHLHFENHQSIELEGIIPLEQILQLQLSVDQTLSLNIAEYGQRQFQRSPEEIFLAGRDLWRRNNVIKRIVLDRELVEIASELMRKKFIRLGFDQLLLGGSLKNIENKVSEESDSARSLLSSKETTLEEVSCIQGAVCGLIICLNSLEKPVEPLPNSFFPVQAGHMTYFTAQANLNFSELAQREGQKFLLIVYAEKTTLYIPNQKDPNLHALKHLGYVFGDRVNDRLHPVLHR